MKLQDLLPLYIDIVKDVGDLGKLGDNYTYYLSDKTKTSILNTNAIELDIKSAFPTICRLLYGDENSFVKHIFSIDDKFERNKFISIFLTEQSKKDGKYYLQDLNLWSKVLVLGFLYCKYDNVIIIQYIKDGVIFNGNIRESLDDKRYNFSRYIIDNNIVFHEENLDSYIRFNKTTITKKQTSIVSKGKYKELPEFINDDIFKRVINGNIHDYVFFNKVKEIYSMKYFTVLKLCSFVDELKKYYMINGQYLNSIGNLSSLDSIDPHSYLHFIIYPILALYRMK